MINASKADGIDDPHPTIVPGEEETPLVQAFVPIQIQTKDAGPEIGTSESVRTDGTALPIVLPYPLTDLRNSVTLVPLDDEPEEGSKGHRDPAPSRKGWVSAGLTTGTAIMIAFALIAKGPNDVMTRPQGPSSTASSPTVGPPQHIESTTSRWRTNVSEIPADEASRSKWLEGRNARGALRIVCSGSTLDKNDLQWFGGSEDSVAPGWDKIQAGHPEEYCKANPGQTAYILIN